MLLSKHLYNNCSGLSIKIVRLRLDIRGGDDGYGIIKDDYMAYKAFKGKSQACHPINRALTLWLKRVERALGIGLWLIISSEEYKNLP
jgi:hypothetical protein